MSLATNIDQLSTPKGRVLEAGAIIKARKRDLAEIQAELPRYLRQAQNTGATIQDLVDWTGYSRRMVLYHLRRADT